MPDKSKRYSAKLNDVECDFTQVNGELTFTLHLDSEDTKHSLCISPRLSSTNSQSSSYSDSSSSSSSSSSQSQSSGISSDQPTKPTTK